MSKSFLDGLDNECTKYDLAVTAQFRKDYKLAKKRGLKMEASRGNCHPACQGRSAAGKEPRPQPVRQLDWASGMSRSAGLAADLPY